MANAERPKKATKIKYKKVAFKISDKQKKLIEKVCKKQRVTPNRLIKRAIRDYLSRYAELVVNEEVISKNQLRLFDDEEDDDLLFLVADATEDPDVSYKSGE